MRLNLKAVVPSSAVERTMYLYRLLKVPRRKREPDEWRRVRPVGRFLFFIFLLFPDAKVTMQRRFV